MDYVSKETRTDFVGTYTAYIYPDGHTETDPPGRPMTREDVQRQRLRQASTDQARKIMAASQVGTSSDTLSTRREKRLTAIPQTLTQEFHDTMQAMGQLAEKHQVAPSRS
jgi:hypothetical protein